MSGIIAWMLLLLLLMLFTVLETRLAVAKADYNYFGNTIFSDVYRTPSPLTSHPYCNNQSNHEDLTRFGIGPGEAAEQTSRSKVEVFGEILKRHVHELRRTANRKVELVFLVDSSASVGSEEFLNELKFVKKLLADFTVDRHTTRVSVVTFSSRSRVVRHIDHLTHPRDDNHKCSLLEEELPKIEYTGGGTFTLGAMLEAEKVFRFARPDAKKALFLVTDGYSNGGDPRPAADTLKKQGVEIFTFGIRQGNFVELCEMASEKKEEHTYILNTFEEFEVLARRALHEDLHVGNYIIQNSNKCNGLCDERKDCCDSLATCRCGTHTGKYECVCQAGYYGNGLKKGCIACPEGTYKNYTGPGDKSTCLACPDPNHLSPPGSTSLDQCQCRKGFRAIGVHACAAKTCPDLTKPENGYFVQGQCNNDVNAACGIRCKSGYALNGSSLRLCTEDGTWTGTDVTCEVKRCPRLYSPQHGEMDCTKADFSFDTHCNFRCNHGYRLVGSKIQSCLALALWSGIPPKCREVKCPELPSLTDGKVTPETCTTKESSFGTICSFACRTGYKMVGSHSKQCMENGKWSPDDGSDSLCVDITPPVITCPNNITVEASEDENVGSVLWEIPAAVDNSGFLPTVTVVPALIPPVSLPIGENWITYTAEDSNKNKAKCSFAITVRDTQPPRIDKCISPPPFMRRNEGMEIIWEEPIFSDNSFEPVNITKSHKPGVFPLGTTLVTYIAYDKDNNTAKCVIEITVQEHACANHPEPINGDLDCKPEGNGIACSPSCRKGYGFAITPSNRYYCDYNFGEWVPGNKWPVKDCSVSKKSNHVKQTVDMQFKLKSHCKDRLILNQLENNFENKIKQKVSGYCQPNMACDVGQFETTCIDEEEFDNKIGAFNNFGHENAALISSGVVLERPRRSAPLPVGRIGVEYQRDGAASGIQAKSTVSIKYDITGISGLAQHHEEVQLGVTFVKTKIIEDARNGEFDQVFLDDDMEVLAVDYINKPPEFLCHQGSVLVNFECVKCPGGTFFNVVHEACEGCPKGTYQPEEGQLTCLVCPNNMSTAQNNSRSVQQCRGQCLPGSFSLDGVEWCETCPIGFYQPSYAQLMCLPCPQGTTTWRRGSRKFEDCGTECKEGYVSKTGLEPCFPCPRGYFQPDRGKSSCFLCPDGVKTRNSGSVDITDCEGISESAASLNSIPRNEISITECFSEPCQNGAQCVSLNAGYTCQCQSGWTGMHCEIEVDECLSNPCQNNGTCLDEMNGYNCTCHLGYGGIHCDVNIDECASDPCLNNATCVDLIDSYQCECVAGFNGTHCEENIDDCMETSCKNNATCVDGVAEFKCECPPGFQGTTCEIDINECASVPCQNNATCIDDSNSFSCLCKAGYIGAVCEYDVNECASSPCQNGATCIDLEAHYVCKCPPSFSGLNCETQLNSTFDFDFPTSGITDYVAIEDPFENRNLSAFTIAMWIKTGDRENPGTPLSYATETDDNALVITDYSGFVVYINGKIQHTDVVVNDGKWHHIALTWSSQNGAWQIFKDGQKESGGMDVKTGTSIQSGGVLVIGQEQDSRGGRFSISESFVGRISKLNIWDFVLSADDIRGLTTTCDDYIGNLIAWPDFLSGINGRVQQLETDICRGCNPPLEVSNGFVAWNDTGINATATYSCNVGYEVDGPSERVCHIDSTWSKIEPRCTKVSCGYPGDIRNGLIIDSYYTYGNTIHYTCNSGFKLVGSKSRYCNASAQWEGEEPECVEIVCILPPLKANLRSNKLTDFKPGDNVRFNCTAGHHLLGNRILKCNMTGNWEGSLPECEEIRCRPPPEISNGRVIAEHNKTFPINSFLTLECVTGFNISSGNQIRCGDSGIWLFNDRPTLPSCLPRSCHRLTSPRNGFVDSPFSPIYQTKALYRCEVGYILFGTAERTCLADSTWSGESPSCNPIGCPPPGDILHGHVMGSEFFYKGKIIYFCDQGYVLYGSAERICGSDGTWRSSVPTCEPIKCPDPGTIAHGHIFGSVYILDSIIEFTCDSGFQLVGAKRQKCLANGTWSENRPTCEKVLCPEPPPLPNGDFVGSSYETGSVVQYTCNKGYEIEGKDTRSCRLDGTWTGPTPKCNSIRCVLPVSIKHGRFLADETTLGETTLGSTIKYQCESGYVLDGPINRTCTDGKEWTGRDPSCLEVTCEKPDGIAYGSVNGDNYRVGSSVFYKCEPGYELKGSTTRFCTEGKIWNGTEPHCRAVNCTEPSTVISNGRMIGSNISYGATVHYVCDDGYYIDGATSRTCRADGSWSNPVPVCERVECSRPTKPPNCDVAGFDYRFKEKIRYTCRTGYQLVGPNERICQADKTWSGGEPRCVQIECSRPANITNGRVILQGLFYKNVAFYQCNSRFWLKGSEKRECTENGTWSGVEPTCVEVTCGKAPLIDYGRPVNDQIQAGMTVEYKCDEGYLLVQSAKLTCSLQGSYSGDKPRCIKVQCPKPQPIANGQLDATDIILGSVLRYSCDEGFEIVGQSEQVCREDSQWSGVDPICVVVNCGPPDYVPDTTAYSDRYDYGATVTYSCNEGFVLESGDLNRTCLAEKKWSGEPPVCKKMSCPRPTFLFGFIAIAAGESRIEQNVQEMDRFVHGMTVEFDCEAGFILNGERELSCLINGSWSDLIPSCERISCPDLNITHGIILSPKGFKYGFRTLISCEEGYELNGSMELNCLANGSWSAEIPTCLAVICEDPPHIDNVDIQIIDTPNQGFGYPFGITIGFQCYDGFELIGASVLKCLGTRQWSNLFPTCKPITCSPPLIEGNAVPLVENPKDVYAFAEKLSFKCGDGYELIGSEEIACNENKTWNGTVPHCELSVCPSLNIPHAILNGSSFLFGIGTVLSVECEDGYRLSGSSFLKCLHTKTWSAESPECIEVNCLLPVIPNSGDIAENKSENVSVGELVIFECKIGYKLSGASSALCLNSGNWSEPIPQCVTVICPPFTVDGGQVVLRRQGSILPNVFEHGFTVRLAAFRKEPEKPKNDSIYQYGDVVDVVCETGFVLASNSSNNSLVCETSGSWAGHIPTCDRVLCPEPSVKNAQVKLMEDLEESTPTYSFGALIVFACDQGYKLVGEAENLCQVDGTWSEPYPTCELVQCPRMEIANANISSSNTSYGTKVTVSCVAGFELFGDADLACQANGVWSGLTPLCLKVACKIPEIAFARLLSRSPLVSTVTFGDKIRVECHDGFRMVGQAEITCGFNKQWLPNVPMCERKYCLPLNLNITNLMHEINYGTQNADKMFPFGTEVKFECELGYHLDGQSSIRCEANQSWSSSVPNCSVVFCPQPFIENGYIKTSSVKNSYTFGQSIRFRCNPGFEMRGEAEMFCQPNGEWTEQFPICVRLSCPEIPQIPNALAIGNSTFFEAVVEYQCDVGYIMVGENYRYVTCLANQTWSSRPSCHRVRCSVPKNLKYGEYLTNGFLYENILRYACHRGYELQGQADHVCLASGQWSGEIPVCEKVNCSRPPFVPHADVVGDSFLFGDTLLVKCHEGYRLSGFGSIECLWNKTWSRVQASCKIVTCGEPRFVWFAKPVIGKREFNSTVKYVCNVGYEIQGTTESTCLANGSWTYINTTCSRVKCPLPNMTHHGLLIIQGQQYRVISELENHSGFYYEAKIVHSCEKGYELLGRATQICMSDSQWNGTLPKCEPVECFRPPKLQNAQYAEILRNTYTYGQTLTIQCETGYLQKGLNAVTCQHDRTWNISGILCEKVKCPVPGFFQNGGIRGVDFTYGGQISYSCLEGYVLTGEKTRICGENGKWNGSEPSCRRITCPQHDLIENGYVEGKDYSYQAVRIYHCNTGYRLSGDSRRTCQSDGQWSGRSVACTIQSCSTPEHPDHGVVITNSTTYQSVAEYQCNTGYEIYGEKYRICDHNGWWTGFTPTCVLITCIDPPPILNGLAIWSSKSFSSVVRYTCDNKYALVGKSERKCQADRMWSGEAPTCRLKLCPDPVVQPSVKFSSSDFTVGSTIKFSCTEGFTVVGKRFLTCGSDETWNGHFPDCERVSCKAPPPIANAVATGESHKYGDVVKYTCISGYKLQGSPLISCEANGLWSNVTAVCNPISCGNPPLVKNAKSVYTGVHFGEIVYYLCNEGYDLNGNNLIECSVDGIWAGSLPHCELITCGVVPVIPHASTIVHRTTYGSKASYECNRGYILHGSSKVECKANGTWAYENRPTCLPVECGEPQTIQNGGVRASDKVYNGVATYFCLEGFKLSGNPVIHCGEDGQWSSSRPTCEPIICNSPETILNGSIFGSDFSFGHNVLYSCKEGYRLVGDSIRTCQPDGTWSGRTPECELIYCGLPESPGNGSMNFTGLHYGSKVKYWCLFGYSLVGADTATCDPDGNWTNPVPDCLATGPKKECLPLPAVENSIEIEKKFIVGDSVTIQCKEGYVPSGSVQVTCQDDLTWTGLQGKCQKVTCHIPRHNSMVVIHGYNFKYGDRTAYACRQGLIPATDPVITCMANGQWDKVPECRATCKFECRNGGTCIGPNKCKCQQGYGGRFCETAICVLPCLNGGQCVAPYKCECPYGYGGFRCELPICVKPCQNGGRCIMANRCLCPHGFVPPFCESSRLVQQRSGGRR